MAEKVKVWDPLVRVFHWGLVLSFAVAWLSSDHGRALHQWAGYAAGSLIAMRIVWGILGTRYARFGQFVRNPAAALGHLADMLAGRERRYIGHNPAGGLMIVALMVTVGAIATTGWMMTTSQFWGYEWVEDAHEMLAELLVWLVLLHLAGVVFASLRHGENLAAAMVTGRKRAPRSGDVV